MSFRDAVGGMQRHLFDTFGEDVTYLAAGQAPKLLPKGGIFRQEHLGLVLETGADLSTTRPTLDVIAADVAPRSPVVNKDHVVVRGEDWTVSDVRPDGEGIVTLYLTNPKRFG